MLKKLFFAYVFFNSIVSFSQEIVNSTSIELKKNVQIFQVVNDSTKQTTMFIGDENRIKAIRLDDKMKFIDSVSTPRPEKSYTYIIGNVVSGNKTTLFWSSSNQKKILAQGFDSKNSKISDKIIDLEYKNEVYLQEFSVGNKFLILTLVKKSNLFKLYVFDNRGNLEIKDIDLSGIKFYHRSSLYETFEEEKSPLERPLSLENINFENPSSLVKAAKKRKCYALKKKIVITIDTDQNYTQVIQIDLESYKATSKNILQPPFKNFGTPEVNFNSFLLDNKLYQVKASSDKFHLTIKDLNDTLLKEYIGDRKSTIYFKNSEISQQGTDFGGDSKKTLEKSSPFIKSLKDLNIAVSCYQTGQNTLVTLGGVSTDKASGSQAVLMQFGAIGSLINSFANSNTESFNSYYGRTAVTISGLFDKDGNHVNGDLQPLAYDKIGTFLADNKKASVQSLIKIDNMYYLGYYDKDAKEYIIRKFAD